jgi:hypothetical protein
MNGFCSLKRVVTPDLIPVITLAPSVAIEIYFSKRTLDGNIVACGLVKFISTFEFLAVSHLVADVMGIVCGVSRVFQNEDLTFTVVKEALGPACSAILYMKSSAGPMLVLFRQGSIRPETQK